MLVDIFNIIGLISFGFQHLDIKVILMSAAGRKQPSKKKSRRARLTLVRWRAADDPEQTFNRLEAMLDHHALNCMIQRLTNKYKQGRIMKFVGTITLAAAISMLISAQAFAIPVFEQKESSNSWRSQEDACTYGIARAREFAKRYCRRVHGGKPASYEANCENYRQMRSGEWKATGNVILQCDVDG